MHRHAVIVGHSYIKRLKNSIMNAHIHDTGHVYNYSASFGLAEVHTSFYGVSGATTRKISQHVHIITENKPHIVILQVGGNDFSGQNNDDHKSTAADIIAVAHSMIQAGVLLVFVGKLFYRKRSRFLTTHNAVQHYNTKAVVTSYGHERS